MKVYVKVCVCVCVCVCVYKHLCALKDLKHICCGDH